MVTGGSSRAHACAISLNNCSASEESPPRSKKLSLTLIDGSCSTRCQIGVSTSTIEDVAPGFTRIRSARTPNKVLEPWCRSGRKEEHGRRCESLEPPWNSFQSRKSHLLFQSPDKREFSRPRSRHSCATAQLLADG